MWNDHVRKTRSERANTSRPVLQFRLPGCLAGFGALRGVGCGGQGENLIRTQQVQRRNLRFRSRDDGSEFGGVKVSTGGRVDLCAAA
jgi:hypothetical protein